MLRLKGSSRTVGGSVVEREDADLVGETVSRIKSKTGSLGPVRDLAVA